MKCEELIDLYELYALGALELGEKNEIDAHLARSCPNCKSGVRRALVLNSMLSTLIPEVKPSKQLKDRILNSVGAKKQGFNWWPVFGVVTAGLMVAMGALWMRDREGRSELAEAKRSIERQAGDLQRVNQILAFLNEPETRLVGFGTAAPSPRGNVFVNSKSGRLLMIASNLPALDQGKTYQAWVIKKGDPAPKPAGLFRRDANGGAVYQFPDPVELATLQAVAVSVEPEGGSQTPTSVIVVAPVGP